MRIFAIELENFKMLEKKRVEFPAMFSVLIGENGMGKTTLMEASRFFLARFIESLSIHQVVFETKHFRYWSDEFGYIVRNSSLRLTTEFERDGKRNLFVDHVQLDQIAAPFGATKWFDNRELREGSKFILQEIEQGEYRTLPVIAKLGTSPMDIRNSVHYSSKTTRLEAGYRGALFDVIQGEGFLSWFKTFEDEAQKFKQDYVIQQLKTVKEAITAMVPDWVDVTYSFHEDDLVGMMEMPDGRTSLQLYRDLSDGYRRVVALVADIAFRCVRLNPHLRENALRESPGVVLIDEIDQHLHPNWQKRIVADLKRTFPKIQFIATTHSPFIVQSLSANEVIDLDGKIEYNPKELQIGDVAKMMGVESPYSAENEENEALAERYLHAVRGM